MSELPVKDFIDTVDRVAGLPGQAGNFVAGPEPTSAIQRGLWNVARKSCDALNSAPGRVVTKIGPVNAVAAREICGPYWQANNYDDPVTAPPFPGGQCAGQLYNYSATVTQVNNLGQSNDAQVTLGTSRRLSGPIVFVGVEETANAFIPRVRNASGGVRTMVFVGSGVEAVYSKPTTESLTMSNITVSPVDGCGDPPPETQPGGNVATDPGEQFDFDLNINNELSLNDELINTPFGEFLLSELVEGILGSLGGASAEPIDPGLLGNGEPEVAPPVSQNGTQGEGGGDEDFGEPPEGRIWVGGVVEVTGGDSLYGNIASSGPENTVYPRVVGNVSLKLEDDNSGIIRGDAKQIRSRWSESVVDVTGLKVTGLRVSVLPEITYRVYPLSVIDKDSLSEGEDE